MKGSMQSIQIKKVVLDLDEIKPLVQLELSCVKNSRKWLKMTQFGYSRSSGRVMLIWKVLLVSN